MFGGRKDGASRLMKAQNPRSLDYLKYLFSVLQKNPVITNENNETLVEVIRLVAEILVWGDQNEPTIMDFFLEKNMIGVFLKYIQQKDNKREYDCNMYVEVFPFHVTFPTDYLLSNNLTDVIITNEFDFCDEEIMGYYISFLKILSLKVNEETVAFFFNAHNQDFALYTETLRFFDHPESMIRAAVRTIVLNVYSLKNQSVLNFIFHKTSLPYFENLVWYLGSNNLQLCKRAREAPVTELLRDQMEDLVAENIDNLHYINDILCLGVDQINRVLIDVLLHRFLLPLHIYSLSICPERVRHRHRLSSCVAMFLLAQVFRIITEPVLIQVLTEAILIGNFAHTVLERPKEGETEEAITSVEKELACANMAIGAVERAQAGARLAAYCHTGSRHKGFCKPSEPLIDAINRLKRFPSSDLSNGLENAAKEDGELAQARPNDLQMRPYWRAVLRQLDLGSGDDYKALLAICLLSLIRQNRGIDAPTLALAQLASPTRDASTQPNYNAQLCDQLVDLICLACRSSSKVRVVTLQLAVLLLTQLTCYAETPVAETPRVFRSFLDDKAMALLTAALEESALLVRAYYKKDYMFLDLFEHELRSFRDRSVDVRSLIKEARLLLPVTGMVPVVKSLSDARKQVESHIFRLPSTEYEHARRAVAVFFIMHTLIESKFQPFVVPETCVDLQQITSAKFDLSHVTSLQSLIASDDELIVDSSMEHSAQRVFLRCTVTHRRRQQAASPPEQCYMVIRGSQLLLVKPDKRIGWTKVTFAGRLQDVSANFDKTDQRSLIVNIEKQGHSVLKSVLDSVPKEVHLPEPALSAKFCFDDYLRSMGAESELTKGRDQIRSEKFKTIGRLLDYPDSVTPLETSQAPSNISTSPASSIMFINDPLGNDMDELLAQKSEPVPIGPQSSTDQLSSPGNFKELLSQSEVLPKTGSFSLRSPSTSLKSQGEDIALGDLPNSPSKTA